MARPELIGSPDRDGPEGRAPRIALALILLLAAALRVYRLDFDLPEVQYVDGFKFIDQAAHMAESGNLRPTYFQYPGLYIYLLVGLYRGLGIVSTYGHQLTAAAASAVGGLGLVAATAYAARAVAGPLGTIVAAALAAASPMLLTESRTPAPDGLCVLFATLAIATTVRGPTPLRAWAAAGAALGLAVGAKWTGAFATPVLVAAALATAWRRRSLRFLGLALGASGVAALVAFLVTTPFFPSLHAQYTADFAYTVACERGGQIGRVQLNALDYLLSRTPTWETPWLGTSLPSDLGAPAFLFVIGGLGLAATGRLGFGGAVYALTAIGYVASVSGAGWIKAIRFLLPAMPFFWSLAGAAAERLVPAAQRRRPGVWLAVALAVTALPLGHALRYTAALRQASTNARTREWMRAQVAPNSVVFLGPFFTDDLYKLPFRFQWLREVGPRLYGLPPGVGLSPERNPLYGPELVDGLRRAGVEYVVINSYFDGAFANVPENARFFPRSVERYAAFLARLREAADVVHEETGWDAGRIGPDIQIWRFRTAGEGSAPATNVDPEANGRES